MKAPEFPNDLRWFNSRPLHLADLKGRVVLIDFWTYSCVNCIHTLPHVKSWWKKYAPHGLVIIGVHTPEFEFEKEIANVEKAIKNSDISYPVVMDNDYQIWSLYSNNVWPHKFLIDKDKKIVHDHAGEGGYSETEEAIQKALREVDPSIELPLVTQEDGAGGVCYPTTPETYLGSIRGRAGHSWNAVGSWKLASEYLEHVRRTEGFEDYVALRFEASEVNCVMESKGDRPAKIKIEYDGKAKEFEVSESKMYTLFREPKFAKGELKIFVKDEMVRMYAFTFGGCVENSG